MMMTTTSGTSGEKATISRQSRQGRATTIKPDRAPLTHLWRAGIMVLFSLGACHTCSSYDCRRLPASVSKNFVESDVGVEAEEAL